MTRALARQGLRGWLAVWLVALILGLSAAPCSGLAAPASHPTLAGPADPCHGGGLAARPVCAQMACQAAARLPGAPTLPAPNFAPIAYTAAGELAAGRLDPPPDPPPRLPMS